MDKKTTIRLMVAIMLIGIGAVTFLYFTYAGRPSVALARVSKGDVIEGISLDGTVKGKNEVQLGFENYYPIKITNLDVKVGDLVKAGTTIARLENWDVAAQYKQSLAAVSGAKATLEGLNKSVKLEKLKVEGLTSNARKVQKEQVKVTEKEVEAQKAAVAGAQAGVENMQAQLAKTTIRAPFDGIIAKKDVEVGDLAEPGVPIITLVSNQNIFEIQALVSEQEAAKIKIGDKAAVTLDAYGKDTTFDAQVETIDQSATLQGGVTNYKITFLLNDEDNRIHSGMNANVTLKIAEKKDVLEVPQKAIIADGDKQFVLVSANGVERRKEVTTGIIGIDGMVEIVSGLDGNEYIVK